MLIVIRVVPCQGAIVNTRTGLLWKVCIVQYAWRWAADAAVVDRVIPDIVLMAFGPMMHLVETKQYNYWYNSYNPVCMNELNWIHSKTIVSSTIIVWIALNLILLLIDLERCVNHLNVYFWNIRCNYQYLASVCRLWPVGFTIIVDTAVTSFGWAP